MKKPLILLFTLLCSLATSLNTYSYELSDYSVQPESSTDEAKYRDGMLLWKNNKIVLMYDHKDAGFGSLEENLNVFRKVIDEIEALTNLDITIQAKDLQIVDIENPFKIIERGEVGLYWVNTEEDFAGRAQREYAAETANGTNETVRGSIQLNIDSFSSEKRLRETFLHELLHIIGLAHSEKPWSVLYADPYHEYDELDLDDILGIQALYGDNGNKNYDSAIKARQYASSPLASSSETTYLFKPLPSEFSEEARSKFYYQEPTFYLGDSGDNPEVIKEYDSIKYKENGSLRLSTGGIYAKNEALDISPTAVLIDPRGYVAETQQIDIKIEKGKGGASLVNFSSKTTKVLSKTQGTWTVYLVENYAESNAKTYFSIKLPVVSDFQLDENPYLSISLENATGGDNVVLQLASINPDADSFSLKIYDPKYKDQIISLSNQKNSLSKNLSTASIGRNILYITTDDADEYYDRKSDLDNDVIYRVEFDYPLSDKSFISVTSSDSALVNPEITFASIKKSAEYVTVGWEAVYGAKSYKIYRCQNIYLSSCLLEKTVSSVTSTNITTGDYSTDYFYRVKACDSNYCSGFSSFAKGSKSARQVLLSQIPQQSLPKIVTTKGNDTDTSITIGASKDNGQTSDTNFSSSDNVVIESQIFPQDIDVGQIGNIYIVLVKKDSLGNVLSSLDSSKNWISWNGSLKTLEPYKSDFKLLENELVPIYSGQLVPGTYSFYVGYSLVNSPADIHVSLKPFKITVENLNSISLTHSTVPEIAISDEPQELSEILFSFEDQPFGFINSGFMRMLAPFGISFTSVVYKSEIPNSTDIKITSTFNVNDTLLMRFNSSSNSVNIVPSVLVSSDNGGFSFSFINGDMKGENKFIDFFSTDLTLGRGK